MRPDIARAFISTAIVTLIAPTFAFGQALPGGTLDPLSIPKYVTPLVIPCVWCCPGPRAA